jgi:hypothetical protein
MLLNHLPISFSAQEFSGFSVPYDSADTLKRLRTELIATHLCHRDGDKIFIFPYEKDSLTPGERASFNTTEHFAIANALARNALLRRFEEKGRTLSGLRPISFVKEANLLTGLAAEYFAVYPEYSFNVRPLAPDQAAMVNGIIINFGARFLVKPTAQQLHARGISLKGLYVQNKRDDADSRITVVFSRQLAGRVREVSGTSAMLEDARMPQIALAEAHIEPSREMFERLGRELLGQDYGGFSNELQKVIFEVTGADHQLRRLREMLGWRDLQGDLPACDAFHMRIDGLLTRVSSGVGVGKSRRLTLPQLSLRPGGSITVPWPVDPGIDLNGPFDADSFQHKQARVALIFPRGFQGNVDAFAAQLKDGVPTNGNNRTFTQGMVRKFRMGGIEYVRIPLDPSTNRAQAYRDGALEAARRDVNAAIVVVREEDWELTGADSPYYVSKATLMSQGIPAQMVRIETVLSGQPAFSLNNIALALYAKLNGIPWTLSVRQRLVHEIIMGIGSARISRDRLGDQERIIGITTVFSGDGNYLLGNATAEASIDSYQSALLATLEQNVSDLRRRFGWQPGDKLRIIFHQSFKRYKDAEASAVGQLLLQLRDFEVEYALVQVGEDHDWRLFDPNSKGVSKRGSTIGVAVPERGQIVPLGPHAALVTLTGPRQLKTHVQGTPKPALVAIHPASTFKDLDYIAKQVFDLTFMSWRTFHPTSEPVSIAYPDMIVRLLGNLKHIPNWNPDILTTRLRESRWFL